MVKKEAKPALAKELKKLESEIVGKKSEKEIKSPKFETEQKIDFSLIEKKWQASWEKEKVFQVSDDSKSKKQKCYVLEMFPYPSAA